MSPLRAQRIAPALAAAALSCCVVVTGCGTDEQITSAIAGVTAPPTTPPQAPPVSLEPATVDIGHGTSPRPSDDELRAYVAAWDQAYVEAALRYLDAITPDPPAPPPVRPAGRPATGTLPQRAQASPGVQAPAGGFLACVVQRESGGNPRAVNPSSGAGGLYQFLPSTWQAAGYASRYGVARAELATPAQQHAAAADLYARAGRQPWAGPGC